MKLPVRENAALLTALAILLTLMGAAYWLLDGTAPKAVPQSVLLRTGEQSMAPVLMATPEPRIASTRRVPGPGEVEICGLGIVAAPALNDPQLSKQVEQRQAATLVSVQQRLLASANERDRVAGLVMQAALLPRDDMDRASDALDQDCGKTKGGQQDQEKTPACVAAEFEQEKVRAQHEQRKLPIAQQLVEMAQSTTDPSVYAQAVRFCHSFFYQPSPPMCGAINLTQWSRLDPANMDPWLWALERAQQQKDEAGAAEALYQASKASYEKVQVGFVAQQVLNATDETNEVEQTAVLMQVSGLMYSMGFTPIRAVMTRCSANEVKNANRRQVCEDVANRLVTQSDTLLDHAMGIVIGARLGWAPERIAALRNEYLTVSEFQTKTMFGFLLVGAAGQSPQGCATALRTTRRQLRLMTELGEVGAARQLLLESGPSGQQGRQENVQRHAQQQVQAAASAVRR